MNISMDSKSYADLKYKTVLSLKELDGNIENLRAMSRTIKAKQVTGNLTWENLGDLNRVNTNLKELTYLQNYK